MGSMLPEMTDPLPFERAGDGAGDDRLDDAAGDDRLDDAAGDDRLDGVTRDLPGGGDRDRDRGGIVCIM